MNVVVRLCSRYGFSRFNRTRSTTMRTVVSLAVCLVGMIMALSFMQSLAGGQISLIRMFEWYDARMQARSKEEAEALASRINQSERDVHAFLLGEETALAEGRLVTLRYLAADAYPYSELPYLEGEQGVLVPISLARTPGFSGEELEASVMRRGRQARVVPRTLHLPVSGLYATGDGKNDGSVLLVDATLADASIPWMVAFRSDLPPDKLRSVIARYTQSEVMTWRDANSSLYGALLLEQHLVRLVFLLLFLVVLVSERRAIRRLIAGKKKEMGTLLTLGLRKQDLRRVFLLESVMVTSIGLASGLAFSFALLATSGRWLALLARYSYVFVGAQNLEGDVRGAAGISLILLLAGLLIAFKATKDIMKEPVMEMLGDG